jgi:hypothetical protein
MSKRTMTLNLSPAEMDAIEELCKKKQLTKTALLRQCLRLYQVVEARIDAGEKVFFEDKKKQKSEVMLL